MEIKKRVIIHPEAHIGRDVEIGEYTVIGKDVVIGDRCKIGNFVVIEDGVRIGGGNTIGHGTIIGAPPQDKKFLGEKSYLRIGNNNIIREYVTINRACGEGMATEIGDNNYLMINSHLGHNCKIGNNTVITNLVALSGYVEVEDGSMIGGLTGVHQFVRIGKFSMIGGVSQVRKDVPPYSLVAGVPARIYGINVIGLRRNNVSSEIREEIKTVFKILFKSNLNLSQAIEEAKKRGSKSLEIEHLLGFLQNSKRGVLRFEKEIDEEN